MGKVSEKFIIGALGFSLFDNKKFRERIRQEVREAVEKILAERNSKKPNKIDKAFVKHFEEEVHNKLGKK